MKLNDLAEETQIPKDATIDDVLKMLAGVQKGLSLLKHLKDPNQRLKHANAIFKNYNKIRETLVRLTDQK